jgi:DNA modification methylase
VTDPWYQTGDIGVFRGDCMDVLAQLSDASVDAVVTDPPYSLEFMGKGWDRHDSPLGFQRWCEAWARECLRILKPGGHLLAFGSTRTYHRLAVGIEDAEFEIRDSIKWIYGSGFPKSLDVSKAIDKANGRQFDDRYPLGRHIRERREAAGYTRADVNAWFGYRAGCQHWEAQDAANASVPTLDDWRVLRERLALSDEYLPLVERAEAEREVVGPGGKSGRVRSAMAGDFAGSWDTTVPATEDAQRWEGWGTALKPAHEPIVVARKPLQGTVAANVLRHGTGALNIDGCRVAHGDDVDLSRRQANFDRTGYGGNSETEGVATYKAGGRWPANVVLGEDAAAEMDQQSGFSKSPAKGAKLRTAGRESGVLADSKGMHTPGRVFEASESYGHGDSGGASRFFPVFRYEREFPVWRYEAKADQAERPVVVNGVAHPTVKPLALMRWLVRLVTPPGGVVLEPFAGSGATVEACLLERFGCVAVEREASYLPLIRQRLDRHRDAHAYLVSRGDVEGTLFDLLGSDDAEA